jgi:RHS repeat-associated protein
VDATRNVTYAYDSVGRLNQSVTAAGSLKREDYLHDVNGNRTSVERRVNPGDASPAETDVYTRTAGTNQLASIATASGTRSITYDARGNTASETRPGAVSVTTAYDGYGRLTSYVRTGDPAQANVYNGLDDRVAVTSGGTTSRFVYDPDGRLIGEYGASAAVADVKAEWIWLSPEVANDNQPYGGDDGAGGYALIRVSTAGNTTVSWVHGNHLGVPLVYTNSAGTAVAPPTATLPGFPGQERTLADLYYNRYRDYDPSTGRYIQADPIGIDGGANPYQYAMGNPLRYTDPKGLFIPAIVWGVGEGAVALCARFPAQCIATIYAGYKLYKWATADCPVAGQQDSSIAVKPLLLGKKKKPGGRRAPGIRCTSCDTWHGGSTGTTECRDCDEKRQQGWPLPGPPPRKLED